MTNGAALSALGRLITRRRGLLVLTACAAGLIAASGAGLAQSKKRRKIDLEIRDGKVMSDKNSVRVIEGENVQLNWTTDEPVELHLHGYDIWANAKPGETASMEFPAVATGRFPISSHEFGHATVIYLEVYPRP